MLRRVAKAINLPIRRILDHRFHDIAHRVSLTRGEVAKVDARLEGVVDSVDRRLQESLALQVESLALIGQELREVTSGTDVRGALDELTAEVRRTTQSEHDRVYRERLAHLSGEARIADLDQSVADVINYANSHRGYTAQAGLWMNPPIVVGHREGVVELTGVNERIVEVPFAMRALASVPAGGRVLDFGCAESTVSLSLASLGYDVTALDLTHYPFAHPHLTVVRSPLQDWDVAPGSFDAAVVLSTVEHVGLGWYGEAADERFDDIAAMRRLAQILRPGGLIVLTVPYGTATISDMQRTYDAAGLDTLVDGLEIVERTIVEEVDGRWTVVPESTGHAVALVTARTPGA